MIMLHVATGNAGNATYIVDSSSIDCVYVYIYSFDSKVGLSLRKVGGTCKGEEAPKGGRGV